MEVLTRIGFIARGLMYGAIGLLALAGGRNEDGAGALRVLDGEVGGLLIGAMALGFFGYGLWRLSDAAVDGDGLGRGAKAVTVRLGRAGSGLLHL
ncbi:MAG: DUF1206 domain-containing protein, partial [Pseudomonadota bacterium]|nr:DUF1206 domain-containing protein [Pseudomonadota bacterium]